VPPENIYNFNFECKNLEVIIRGTSMSRSLALVFVSLLLIPTLANNSFSQTNVPNLPPTPKRPVVDEYHGTKVVDDYRWLEDWDNPEVKLWSAAENKHARDYLDHLPSRSAIRERLERLMANRLSATSS
jgi:hypothetical protein